MAELRSSQRVEEGSKLPHGRVLIRATEARAKLGNISASTLWRHVKTGKVPKPIRLGGLRLFDLRAIEEIGNAAGE